MDQTPEYCLSPTCSALAELRQTVSTMHDDASALQVQIDDLKAAGRQARDDATAALDLVSRIRMALNDNGKRMQDELLDYCRELAALPRRVAELEADYAAACADADEWREKANTTTTERIQRLEMQIEALKTGSSVPKFA